MKNRGAEKGLPGAAGLNKPLGRVLLSLAVLCLVFSVFAEHAEARRRLNWGAMKIYTLNLSVGLTYETRWGDRSDSSSLTQDYRLTHTGYALDPRLAHYTAAINLSQGSQLQGGGGDYTVTGFSASLSLFGGIDRKKGIKLWKYVPAPLTLRYSRHTGSGYTAQSYGLSAYYTRPGTLRVFSGRKIIAYDDGTKKNLNLRRSLNSSNGPGDNGSNWNNSNGSNWNSNNNRNWNSNSNSNSNWNRNRNNNWNQNWNQNWNLNRNLEKELKWFRGLEGLLTFGYPTIGLDINRSETKTSGDSFTSTIANLRVRISNPPRKKAGKVVYSSKYALYYNYRDTTRSGTENRLRVESQHDWRRFRLRNKFVHETLSGQRGYYISSRGSYENYLEPEKILKKILKRPVKYMSVLEGTYQKYGDATSYTAGGGLSGRTGIGRPLRISPYLYVDSTFSLQYKRSEARDVYSAMFTERLVYTRLKKTRLTARFGTGYSESGIPVKFSIVANSTLTRKLRLGSTYLFNYIFPSEHRGRYISHEATLAPTYALRPYLTLSGKISHKITDVSNGITARYTETRAHAEMLWRINSRSKLNLRVHLDYTGSRDILTCSARYTARVFKRSRIHLYGELRTSSDVEGARKTLRTTYNWWFGRTSFDAAYELNIQESGSTDHRLNLRLKRTFGRTFSRLW